MLNQRQIRKSTLLLIYAMETQGVDPLAQDSFPFDSYWTLVSENDAKRYAKVLAKATLHETRSLGDLQDSLQSRTENFCATATTQPRLQALPPDARELLRLTQTLPTHIHYLRRHMDTVASDQEVAMLKEYDDGVIRTCVRMCELTQNMLPALEGETGEAVEAYAGVLRRVRKAAAGCARLAHPEQIEPRNEHTDLARYAEAMRERRPLTEQMARDIFSQRGKWEELLRTLLRNYVPERLNTVDRCILYIALNDLIQRKLDPGIVISEACILADEFSGGKSAPFIHGIIATAVMQLTPDAPQPEA